MVIDPTEPKLDLSWLEEMSATGEDEEMGAANLKVPNSSNPKGSITYTPGSSSCSDRCAARRTRFPTDNASNRNCRTQGSVKQ